MRIKLLNTLFTMAALNYETQWLPWTLLHPETELSKYAVVLLNTPISWKPEFLVPFWNKALVRVLVDGGTNRWYQLIKTGDPIFNTACHPTLVTGDMDSVDKGLLKRIQANGCTKIVYTPDQNETDFTKAIREIETYTSSLGEEITDVIAIVGTSGRIDHIMANIETLFHAKKVAKFNVFLLGADSLSWLLSPGKHKIMISKELQKTWCALIPIGKKCDKILTTGLKWNLENHSLSFGELVSTSNTYTDLGYVTIDTSDCILWSMGLAGIPTNYDTAC